MLILDLESAGLIQVDCRCVASCTPLHAAQTALPDANAHHGLVSDRNVPQPAMSMNLAEASIQNWGKSGLQLPGDAGKTPGFLPQVGMAFVCLFFLLVLYSSL